MNQFTIDAEALYGAVLGAKAAASPSCISCGIAPPLKYRPPGIAPSSYPPSGIGRLDAPRDNPSGDRYSSVLSMFGLYKLFFSFESFEHETNLVSFLPPTWIAHTVAVLLHDYRAVYDPPSTSPVYAIHHTILVITKSCKGQVDVCVLGLIPRPPALVLNHQRFLQARRRRRRVDPNDLCQNPAVGMWQNWESFTRPLGERLGTVPLICKGQLWWVGVNPRLT